MKSEEQNLEERRLAALHECDILDTPRDGSFDSMALLASRYFQMPIAIISLVDHDRIWFKSRVGLDVEQVDREPGLCASAILDDNVYVVNDARADPRTLSNPLVASEFGLRFYAGAPIITRDGYRLGVINVIDKRPRTFSEQDQADLQLMATVIAEQLDLRLSARKLMASVTRIVGNCEKPDEKLGVLKMCAWTKQVFIHGQWMEFGEFLKSELGLRVTHGIAPEAFADIAPDLPDEVQKVRSLTHHTR